MSFLFRTAIRRFFGIHLLEGTMAKITEQLRELKTQFSDFAADVSAKLQQLADAQGTFSAEAQQVFNELQEAVKAADTSVGDADGSDTPTVPTEPTTPAEPTPGTVA